MEKAGYASYKEVLNTVDYNVPQCRKRLYIVAFREDMNVKNFAFPKPVRATRKLSALLEKDDDLIKDCRINRIYHLRDKEEIIVKSCKKPYIRIGEIGRGRQGERIYSTKGCVMTLSSSGGGPGGRTGIYLINNQIRKLTPRECARLMGFPDTFQIAETPNQAYKQFGNSIVVNVLQRIIVGMIKKLKEENANGQ